MYGFVHSFCIFVPETKRMNAQHLLKHIWFCVWITVIFYAVFNFSSCASTGELLAGPKDKEPPVLDSLRSTPMNQVNFKKQDIVLIFNEFVEVKDAFKQVLVSPPLNYLPKVTGRGKKITFAFHEKEELRENVTYSIHFGDAIVDFREGNILSNFVFAFSTGDVLDSLTTKGVVLDAKTMDPAENVQVMFYDILEDSIVAKSRPYYSVKTDKNGRFVCSRMKADTFKIVALADKNVNFKYDLETESIGFLDREIIVGSESDSLPVTLLISTPETASKLLAKNLKNYGRMELLYNISPVDPRIRVDNDSVNWYSRASSDTLFIFYDTMVDSFQLEVNDDTISVKTPLKESLDKWPKTRILSTNLTKNMLPGDSLLITFSAPIQYFDINKCKVTDTLGELANLKWNIDLPGDSLVVAGNFRNEMPHILTLDSAAVVDMFGRAMDSTAFSFQLLNPKQTGSLELTITNLDSAHHYFVLFKRGQTILETFTIENTVTFVKKIKTLWPEPYSIEVIQDENKNGKWDPGHYWNKSQPEKMVVVNTEKLEINRLNEFSVKWTHKKAETEIQNTKNE